MQASNSPTPERLYQLAWGYAPPLIIEAAVKHRLFDHLNAGPRTAEELASASGASVRGVRAVADALVFSSGARHQAVLEMAPL